MVVFSRKSGAVRPSWTEKIGFHCYLVHARFLNHDHVIFVIFGLSCGTSPSHGVMKDGQKSFLASVFSQRCCTIAAYAGLKCYLGANPCLDCSAILRGCMDER